MVDKWKLAFQFFDVSGDGLMTEQDLEQIADYISMKTGASPEKAARTRQEWVKWIKYLQPDPSVQVNEDRWIITCAEFCRDKETYAKMLRAWASDLFDSMDLNGDGQISFEELKIFYGSVGLTNNEKIQQIFKELSNKLENFINRESFVLDLVRHFSSSNPEHRPVFITQVN